MKYLEKGPVIVTIVLLIFVMFGNSAAGFKQSSDIDIRTPDNDYDNNDFINATDMISGIYYADSVNINDDPMDFYSMNLTVDENGRDLVTLSLDLIGDGAIRIIVQKHEFNLNMNYVYNNVENLEGNNTHMTMSFIAFDSGPHLIILIAQDIYTDPFDIHYNMRMEKNYGSYLTDGDNNEDDATPVVDGGFYTGDLNETHDHIDLYSVFLESGESTGDGLMVNLTPIDGTSISIRDPDGYIADSRNRIALSEYPSNSDDKEEAYCVANKTGMYYVQINHDTGLGVLSPQLPEVVYHMNITVEPDIKHDNDRNEQQATQVKHNESRIDDFSSIFDREDWYSIEMKSGDEIIVRVDYLDDYIGDLNLDIIGPNWTSIGSSSYGSPDYQILTSVADIDGIHYIRVISGGLMGGGFIGNYSINFQIIPAEKILCYLP